MVREPAIVPLSWTHPPGHASLGGSGRAPQAALGMGAQRKERSSLGIAASAWAGQLAAGWAITSPKLAS